MCSGACICEKNTAFKAIKTRTLDINILSVTVIKQYQL